MTRVPEQPTYQASAGLFTGDVHVEPLYGGEVAPRATLAVVHFAPGARTAWHAHAAGQVIRVLEGRGLVVNRDGEMLDVPAAGMAHAHSGEWHWHGAFPDRFMSHLVMSEAAAAVQWGAHVTDDEYHQAVARIDGDQE